MTHICVMGPSGCGKSTLGSALADRLGLEFLEGDDLHSASNIEKMKAGQPLTDADRGPWLRAVGDALFARKGAVASCSALKRSYRTMLRAACPGLIFVLPELDKGQLHQRTQQREGHFMPPALLADQCVTLEPPDEAESGIIIDGNLPVSRQLEQILRKLSRI